MSKPRGIFGSVAKVVILLFLAVAVLLTGLLFMFIFVPKVVAYIWADHDMNLDEAERMVRKALDEDRKQSCPAFHKYWRNISR